VERFYATVGGRRFIDHTVPKLIEELARLNANLKALVTEMKRQREGREAAAPTEPKTR